MNKYSKALEELVGMIFIKAECGMGYSECEIDEPKETLQELVEKATPKKVIKLELKPMTNEEIETFPEYEYFCPNCIHDVCCVDYCGHCGQALDWSEEND